MGGEPARKTGELVSRFLAKPGRKMLFGEYFQFCVRSPEWKAALIVYEKYKRKFDLKHADLMNLVKFVVDFSNKKFNEGKEVNKDFLIQIASKEIKRIYSK